MSEKHVLYGPGTGLTTDVMQSIYSFVTTHGATCGLRLAFDGATVATFNGVALGTPSGNATWWATGANAYLVLEPVATMPGGNRWQCKIIRVSTTVLSAVWAPIGGWLTSAQTFGSNPQSAITQWNDGAPPGAACNTYISGSDLETYAAGVATYGYTYFRIMLRRSAGAEDAQFNQALYVGGYIPNEPTVDTQPSCFLARNPSLAGASSAWSNTAASANQLSRAPVDNVHVVTDYTNQGHCYVTGMLLTNYARSRAGLFVHKPLYLYNIAGTYELGYFGPYTMFVGASTRTDSAPDAALEYIYANEIVHRWKPSA